MEDSIFATVLLPLALAVIMASLGMSLTVEDFRRVFVNPRGVSIGVLNFALLSPLLAFGVAHVFSLDPPLAVGLVLLGASPGGVLANLLTHLARGDTALSITMTGISSLGAVVTVPLFLSLATSHFGATGLDEHVGMLGVVARVLLITVVPLAIGMRLRARRPDWVAETSRTLRRVTAVIFIAAVVGVIVAEHQRVFDNLGAVAAPAITLNVLAISGSFAIARLAQLDSQAVDCDRNRAEHPQRRARACRGRDYRDGADRARRRLRELHVHPRRPVRLGDVRAQSRSDFRVGCATCPSSPSSAPARSPTGRRSRHRSRTVSRRCASTGGHRAPTCGATCFPRSRPRATGRWRRISPASATHRPIRPGPSNGVSRRSNASAARSGSTGSCWSSTTPAA